MATSPSGSLELVAASSTSFSSLPLPSDQAMRRPRLSKFERLPLEIMLMIMENIPDIKSLKDFSQSSPVNRAAFKAKEHTTVYAVLVNEMGPAAVTLAMVRLAVWDLRMLTIGKNYQHGDSYEFEAMVDEFRNKMIPEAFNTPCMQLEVFTLESACRVSSFHGSVKAIMKECKSELPPPELAGREGMTTVTQCISEFRRITSSRKPTKLEICWVRQWIFYMYSVQLNLHPVRPRHHNSIAQLVYRQFWDRPNTKAQHIVNNIVAKVIEIDDSANSAFESEFNAFRNEFIAVRHKLGNLKRGMNILRYGLKALQSRHMYYERTSRPLQCALEAFQHAAEAFPDEFEPVRCKFNALRGEFESCRSEFEALRSVFDEFQCEFLMRLNTIRNYCYSGSMGFSHSKTVGSSAGNPKVSFWAWCEVTKAHLIVLGILTPEETMGMLQTSLDIREDLKSSIGGVDMIGARGYEVWKQAIGSHLADLDVLTPGGSVDARQTALNVFGDFKASIGEADNCWLSDMHAYAHEQLASQDFSSVFL